MKGLLGISLALALAAGGCNNRDGGDGSAARTTVPPATPTTTTAPADPYAVPATIDESYVQRVVQKLYDIEGEAVNVIIRDQELMPEAVEILRSIFLMDELNTQLSGWNWIINERRLDSFGSDAGRVVIEEAELLQVSRECIQLRATEDVGAAAGHPMAPVVSFLTRPKDPAADPRRRNPTPWMIAGEGTVVDGTACR